MISPRHPHFQRIWGSLENSNYRTGAENIQGELVYLIVTKSKEVLKTHN